MLGRDLNFRAAKKGRKKEQVPESCGLTSDLNP